MKKNTTYTESEIRAFRTVGLNIADRIAAASGDEAWEAIEAFESPERARQVMAGHVSAYFIEIVGVAQALHISAADFFEGVRG